MTDLAFPGEDASDEDFRQFALRLREAAEIGHEHLRLTKDD